MKRDMIELTEAARVCVVGARILSHWLEADGVALETLPRGRAVRRRDLRRVLTHRALPVPSELLPWPRIIVAEDDPAASRLEARILRSLWPDAEVREVADGGAASGPTSARA